MTVGVLRGPYQKFCTLGSNSFICTLTKFKFLSLFNIAIPYFSALVPPFFDFLKSLLEPGLGKTLKYRFGKDTLVHLARSHLWQFIVDNLQQVTVVGSCDGLLWRAEV